MFKSIPDPKADTPTLNRIQQNIQTAFRDLEAVPVLPVLNVLSSTSVTSYTVKASDVYLVVNARGGPIKIVLPTPSRQTQAVKILNGYDAATVTIVQANGGNLTAGGLETGEIIPDAGETADLVCDGKLWWLL